MPLIAVTPDVSDRSGRLAATVALTYLDAIRRAGGTPVILHPDPTLIPDYLAAFDAFVFTGGKDIDMTAFNEPNHPQSDRMDPRRQTFDLALHRALADPAQHETPVLAVCLGMQEMSLIQGGSLHQHLPDTLPTADHHRDAVHAVAPTPAAAALALAAPSPALRRFLHTSLQGPVASNHHQGITNAGSLTVLATSPDGLIEAVANPHRPFYVGVQWHPERTDHKPTGDETFQALVEAAELHRAAPNTGSVEAHFRRSFFP